MIQPNYLMRHRLSLALEQAVNGELGSRQEPIRVIDIGCGQRPYQSLFENVPLKHYWGTDVVCESQADVVCTGEQLPFQDESADCVICVQVLEHVEDPDGVVSEIHRILHENGLALVSTHGVMVYHPTPHDYWRWTQEGLRKLFSAHEFRRVELVPIGGSFSTLSFLAGWYVHLFANKVLGKNKLFEALGKPMRDALILMLNLCGLTLDYLFPYFSDPEGTNTLICAFLVIAPKRVLV